MPLVSAGIASARLTGDVLFHRSGQDDRERGSAALRKKTASGTAIEMKAAVARISQLPPRVPSSSTIWLVITVVWPVASIRKTFATRRSFQVHRNWKIAKDAKAGNDSGRMILTKIWKSVAPVHLCILDDVAWQADHVVAQEVDRERQAEAGMRQPDAEIPLSDPDAEMQLAKAGSAQAAAARPADRPRRTQSAGRAGRESPSMPAHMRRRPRSLSE